MGKIRRWHWGRPKPLWGHHGFGSSDATVALPALGKALSHISVLFRPPHPFQTQPGKSPKLFGSSSHHQHHAHGGGTSGIPSAPWGVCAPWVPEFSKPCPAGPLHPKPCLVESLPLKYHLVENQPPRLCLPDPQILPYSPFAPQRGPQP